MRKLGVYWSSGHQRPTDLQYTKALDPAVVRVYEADSNRMKLMHEAVPYATIFPRIWDISEEKHKPIMQTDPVGLGKTHAAFWDAKLTQWAKEGLSMNRDMIYVCGINEPRVWPDPQIDRRSNWSAWYTATARQSEIVDKYTTSFMDNLTSYGIHGSAFEFSVGWPTNLNDEEASYWGFFEGSHQAIIRNKGVVNIHEYWYCTGPQTGWGWYGGRWAHIPWQDVKIVIGECGIENMVDEQRMKNEGRLRGWKGSVSASTYAQQLAAYQTALNKDPRVWGAFVFLTDFYNNEWASQDTDGAHVEIVNAARNDVGNLTLITPDKLKPITPPPGSSVDPSPGKDFVWPISNAVNKISQYWGRNPADYAKFGLQGHNGLDFACVMGTNCMSIAEGVVMMVATDPSYGNYVRVYHPKYDICSFYAHLRDAIVIIGQRVTKGQIIGHTNNTGNSNGPHLHLEIRKMNGEGNTYEAFNTGFGNKAQLDPFTFLKMFA